MTCLLFGPDWDGTCCWCDSPREAHPKAECMACDGWGFVRGFDQEPFRCPDECDDGTVTVERKAA